MSALPAVFKLLKPWQAGVLAAVLLGALGATYGVYAVIDGSGGTDLGENQQLIPVQLGDLVNQVSTNGSIVFPNRETLSFGTQGTIGEVLVEEGQHVEEGQILASLDQSTVASLEKSVAQARISLRDAEDALAQALDPHTTLNIARAEASVADARLSLQGAQETLEGLLAPTSQQIAQAEAAVANSRISLERAQDDLAALLEPSGQEIAEVEAGVANARLALEDAQEAVTLLLEATTQDIARAEVSVTDARIAAKNAGEALEELLAGPTEDDLTAVQSQIDSAGTALANALRDLSLARNEWDRKVEAAQESLDAALDGYRDSFEKWLGTDPDAVDGAADPDTLLASWGVDLEALFDPDARFQDSGRGFLAAGPPPDDPATPWSEFVVYAWTNLHPAPLVGDCGDTQVDAGTLCVRDEMDAAWTVLESASDDLETVETQAAKAVSNAEVAVARSEDSLAAAKEALAELEADLDALEIESREKNLALSLANLNEAEESMRDLSDGSNTLQVEAKRKQVAVTQANVDAAVDELEGLTGEPDPLDVAAARNQVAVVRANLEAAEDDLAELTGDPDPVDLYARIRQVELAQASLGEAEDELAELFGGVDPLEIALREADVASARLALEGSLKLLEGATLVAPMAGIVSLVNLEAGQSVNANVRAIEIVDPTIIEVDGIVDEIDVLFVQVGARAEVTMDALPGQVLVGTVSSVALAAETQQGVVSYPIRIQVQLPQGIQPVEGLSATANIVIREDNDVLLVPLQALYGTFEQPLVRVSNGESIEERPVSVGNSDDFWIAVLDGLNQGEQVVIEASEASTDPFAQIRQQFQAGGRGGPGGGGLGGGGLGGGGRPPIR